MKVIAGWVAGILAVGAFVALVIATQGFGMFLQQRQNNFQNHMYQHGYGTLTADQQQLSSDMQAFNDAKRQLDSDKPGTSLYNDDNASLHGVANDACSVVAKMQASNFDLGIYGQWASANCSNGAYNK